MDLTTMPPQLFCTDEAEVLIFPKGIIGTFPIQNKPTNALWTSNYTPDEEYPSEWVRWCEKTEFHCGKNKFLLIPKDTIKVFQPLVTLDLQPDLTPREFPVPCHPVVDFGWYADKGYDGFRVDMADIYNLRGQYNIDVLSPFRFWDCESTAWFNYDWIAEIQKI